MGAIERPGNAMRQVRKRDHARKPPVLAARMWEHRLL